RFPVLRLALDVLDLVASLLPCLGVVAAEVLGQVLNVLAAQLVGRLLQGVALHAVVVGLADLTLLLSVLRPGLVLAASIVCAGLRIALLRRGLGIAGGRLVLLLPLGVPTSRLLLGLPLARGLLAALVVLRLRRVLGLALLALAGHRLAT